ncbi:MAG: radical SAM-associated putative lipoprotein [Phocaeicola sp.]|uniref:radical SAM-associated putative lipoprotein n=1 Tax=Phocaeicola sp. TaxID=2773926 RepID=UPI003FA13C90
MKIHFNKIISYLLTGILGILGFSSCVGDEPDEYGTPTVDYVYKGKVTDEKDVPIQGIQVAADLKDPNDASIKKDTIYTDANGEFQKKITGLYTVKSATIKFSDVDGKQNGSFQDATITTEDLVKTKKRNGWYLGEFTFTANQKLKKK